MRKSHTSVEEGMCDVCACAGGSLADLCGTWAGQMYPDTKVRVITFGAPSVSIHLFIVLLCSLSESSQPDGSAMPPCRCSAAVCHQAHKLTVHSEDMQAQGWKVSECIQVQHAAPGLS